MKSSGLSIFVDFFKGFNKQEAELCKKIEKMLDKIRQETGRELKLTNLGCRGVPILLQLSWKQVSVLEVPFQSRPMVRIRLHVLRLRKHQDKLPGRK